MPEYGKVAYDSYCYSSGGVSLVSGEKLPEWDGLSPEIQAAWTHAANEVLNTRDAEQCSPRHYE